MSKVDKDKIILITGGAGFIGTNVAKKYLDQGRIVRLFDNLSRNGVEQNLEWLCNKYKDKVQVIIGDVTNELQVQKAVKGISKIFHFAAQVAVTTSLVNPIDDFNVNVKGTLNMLEAIKNTVGIESFIYTSTNKVYGDLNDIELNESSTRYEPVNKAILEKGIGENRPLDFHSPYGCSKGAADQYVLDYYRSYRIPTAVFRMSCMYGPFQYGTEDQGWVAHFVIQALQNRTITLYGNGKQVRDVLYIDDLVDAFDMVSKNIHKTAGNVFNIGGGIKNTVSLIEILNKIKSITGKKVNIIFDDWRTGDQKYYVSNIIKAQSFTNWTPKHSVDEGLTELIQWQAENNPNIKLLKRDAHLLNKIKNKAVA